MTVDLLHTMTGKLKSGLELRGNMIDCTGLGAGGSSDTECIPYG